MVSMIPAMVEECRTTTPINGSVCLGGNICAEGHEGLICGRCSREWARDQFPGECLSCTEMPDSFSIVLSMMGSLTAGSLFNQFLTIQALSKTETQKNILAVLLRMYTHWATQVSVLGQFNMSKIEGMDFNKEPEEETVVVVSKNGTLEEAAPAEAGLPWPPWFNDISKDLFAFKDAMPRVGSDQEKMECLIDKALQKV